MKERYLELCEACVNHKENIYLLIDKDSLRVTRYAWGDSLDEAKNYFKNWLESEVSFLTLDDFFITRIMKDTMDK